ncbi:inlA [Symbiodinium sp. CCMP2592]|nr:inlA [Symbiodinium sp. CCMP2592]
MHSRCSGAKQEAALRAVLLKLGIQNEALTGSSCRWPGVECRFRFCDVEVLRMSGIIQGTGSIPEELGQLPYLCRLDLRGFQVQGNLAALARCKRLVELRLDGGTFEKAPVGRLQTIVLSGTGLDLAELRVARQLRDLTVYQAGTVRGNISDLKRSTRLLFLSLPGAHQVKGDLGDFQGMPRLRKLCLQRAQARHTYLGGSSGCSQHMLSEAC